VGATLIASGPPGPGGAPAAQVAVALAAVTGGLAVAYPFEVPAPGQQVVAVKLTIKNTGTLLIRDSAQADTTVRDTAGQTSGAVVLDVNGCDGFPGGVIGLDPGASATGCVAFELPTGATVVAVKFGLGGALAASVATWLVP
jgi:hypothetical protein